MVNTTKKGRHPGGRPPKFREARRPITVTLPERTLARLEAFDGDRAHAIVKAVDAASDVYGATRLEVVEVAPGSGILIVPRIPSLKCIPWLRMVEVAPKRYLLTVTLGTPIEKVELGITDLIESSKTTAPHDVPLLRELRDKLGALRRGERITKAEILFVATET